MINESLEESLIEEFDEKECYATCFELTKDETKIKKDYPPLLGKVKRI